MSVCLTTLPEMYLTMTDVLGMLETPFLVPGSGLMLSVQIILLLIALSRHGSHGPVKTES